MEEELTSSASCRPCWRLADDWSRQLRGRCNFSSWCKSAGHAQTVIQASGGVPFHLRNLIWKAFHPFIFLHVCPERFFSSSGVLTRQVCRSSLGLVNILFCKPNWLGFLYAYEQVRDGWGAETSRRQTSKSSSTFPDSLGLIEPKPAFYPWSLVTVFVCSGWGTHAKYSLSDVRVKCFFMWLTRHTALTRGRSVFNMDKRAANVASETKCGQENMGGGGWWYKKRSHYYECAQRGITHDQD